MGIRTKLIAVAISAATVVTGVSAATAATASPAASATTDGKKPSQHDATLAKVAKSLGVTVKQLRTALVNLKQALAKGVDKAVAVGAFAKELGVSLADAEKALQALSSKDKEPDKGVPEEAVKLLAAQLHISADQARRVFKDLEKVNGKGGDIVKDPTFIAIAKRLGITPQRLLDALIKVKQELVGKEKEKETEKDKEKVPSGSPAK